MILKLYRKILYMLNPKEYWVKQGAIIGENCDINRTASLGSEPYLVEIGNHVRISNGVKISTHDGSTWVLKSLFPSYFEKNGLKQKDVRSVGLYGKVKIGDNVHIGNNAYIMPGINIGDNSIIGVGAIVTKDVPSNTIVAGIPARVIKTVEEYVDKHLNDFDFSSHSSSDEKRAYLKRKFENLD